MSDVVNHPSHYTRGKIEVWDFIVDQGLNYLLGNVCKYICRAGHKNNYVEDLKKARAYLDREIRRVEENSTVTIAGPSQFPPPYEPIGTGIPYPDPSMVIVYKKDTK